MIPAAATAGAPTNMPVFRIRMQSSTIGSQHEARHADVIADSSEEALLAAQQDRVQNWRLMASWDRSSTNYRRIDYVGPVPVGLEKYGAPPIQITKRRIGAYTIHIHLDQDAQVSGTEVWLKDVRKGRCKYDYRSDLKGAMRDAAATVRLLSQQRKQQGAL